MESTASMAENGLLVGVSQHMKRIQSAIHKAAAVNVPVLIVGETGTGKELVARELHNRSRRSSGPFVAVNMGAISTELVASELFGHVKGAFTGATDSKIGCYKEADQGTLFLDEIATMDDRVQIALLRLLETGTYRPVGAKADEHADVRVIAATNIELAAQGNGSHFRQDLLYRFSVFTISLPPLRERMEDVPQLVRHFIRQVRADFGFPIEDVSVDALQLMSVYNWPGNIRELKNAVAEAAILAEEGTILPRHLPARIRIFAPDEPAVTALPLATLVAAEPGDGGTSGAPQAPATEGVFLPGGCSLEEVQRLYTLRTLETCGNNKTAAAKVLGVSRKSLYEKLRRWEVRSGFMSG